jgi:flagellar assembly protein FliH
MVAVTVLCVDGPFLSWKGSSNMTSKIFKGAGTKDKSKSVRMVDENAGVVHRRVLDARGKAEKILQDAEADAEKTRIEARRVLEESKTQSERAIKKGFSEGEAKGFATVTEKLVELEHLRERFYESVEPELIKLSMSIAEKVIGKLASENSKLVEGVVHQALEKTLGDRIVIRLNPEDYSGLMERDVDFREKIDRTKRLTLRSDEAITKGGCVVESEVGTIDAQLDLQLEAMRKALEISD